MDEGHNVFTIISFVYKDILYKKTQITEKMHDFEKVIFIFDTVSLDLGLCIIGSVWHSLQKILHQL